MIAKIIAYGRTRDEALARLRRAMAETTVVIEGGATNKSFVLDLLAQPEVIDGRRPTPAGSTGSAARAGWSRTGTPGSRWSPPAIEAYEDEEQVERQRLLETAHGGRPQAQHEVGRAIDLKLRGVVHRVTVARIGPHRFRVGVGADGRVQTVDAELERLDDYTGRLVVGDQRFRLRHRDPRAGARWSRSTASPTGSAGTRAACCARPRRRWWSPPRWRSATRSRPAHR